MTTEEKLKKDAEKSLDKRLGTYAYIRKQDCYINYVDGYIDGAAPREKQIAEAKEIIKLLLMNCVGVYENTGKTIAEIQAEAEQFLKEVEQ